MRKRLRKKKHLREFVVYGFEIAFDMSGSLTTGERKDLLDRFILEAIEQNGLLFGGGGPESSWSGFAVRAPDRDSATDQDRQAVERWLQGASGITRVEVGPLRDAFYGWE
jgi:uncharacterized protein